jgi:hypothetical protein
MSGQLQAPATLPRYLFDRRLGGPQSRSGRSREEKILDPTGTRNPTPQWEAIIAYGKIAIPGGSHSKRSVYRDTVIVA